MPDVSADVQQSGIAVAPGASDATEVVPHPPNLDGIPVADPPPAQATASTEDVPTPVLTPAARRRKIGLATGGYLLLILATILALALPRMKLKAGFGEDLLVILSMLGMIVGAAMTLLSLVWNILRQ
jgi:hypothetical protein